jgi:hypothetical protein
MTKTKWLFLESSVASENNFSKRSRQRPARYVILEMNDAMQLL